MTNATTYTGRIVALLVALVSPWLVSATEVKPGTEYRDRVKVDETVQPLGDSPFGESVNLYKGGLSFLQQDINYPGTGPTIRLARSYSLGGNGTNTFGANEAADWALTIPRIQTILPGDRFTQHGEWKVAGTDPYARCSQISAIQVSPFTALGQLWWHGYQLQTEDGAQQTLLRRTSENTIAPSTGAHNIVTTKNWMVSCLGATANGMPGEAFLVTSPDGTRYWFDQLVYGPPIQTLELTFGASSAAAPQPSTETQTTTANTTQTADPVPVENISGDGTTAYLPRKMGYMFVTRIEDRFGNFLTYSYANNKLIEISGSDGRKVSIEWNSQAPVIRQIKVEPVAIAAPQTWTFAYNANFTALTSVVLPDNSSWTFALNFLDREEVPPDFNEPYCSVTAISNVGITTWNSGSMTHPSGLTGTFDTGMVGFGRSRMPSTCNTNSNTWNQPITYLGLSLLKKTLTGPGISTQAWTYNYSDAVGSTATQCAATGCATTAYVEVKAPDTSVSRYVHSTAFDASEGRLLSVYMGLSAFNLVNPSPLQKSTHGYAANNAGPWPTRFGDSIEHLGLINHASQEQVGPENSVVIERQGATFSRATSAFDAYMNPLSVTRSSAGGAAGPFSRLEVATYQHDLSKWVLGLPRTVSCVGNWDCGPSPGLVMSEIDYGANDLPWHTRSYGVLSQTLTYSGDGQLAAVSDGRGKTTSFAAWYRGLPSSITFPGTVGGVPATTMSAGVSANGQLKNVTDQTGAQTCYDHDAMGRIISVYYPSETANPVATCDRATSNWRNKSQAFTRPAIAEYGIAIGHWKQTVSTGNGRATTFYDAKWQPVLVLTEDTGSALSKSFVVNRYDTLGRRTFTSYPVGALGSVNDALTGVRTTYDFLGRSTQVQQDNGATPGAAVLNSTTTYLPDFQTKIVNPRGFQTISSYQAYDEPSMDSPVLISLPEGVSTKIDRQPSLAKPVTITRSGLYGASTLSLARTYLYDTNQRLCVTNNPESGATVLDYDGAGNVAWSAEGLAMTSVCNRASVPLASMTSFTYDALNRPVLRSTTGGTANVATTYAPDGKVIVLLANNPGTDTVTNTYTYNRRRLLTRETVQVNAVAPWGFDYAYNSNGHLSSQTYPGSVLVGYAPDALGRPSQVGTFASGVTYYPGGAISGFTYGNGIVHSMTPNARQLPARSVDAYGATKYLDDSYTYDPNGNVMSMTDAAGIGSNDRTWGVAATTLYDGLDRLLRVRGANWGTLTGSYNALFTYDPLDNLRSARIGASGYTHAYDLGVGSGNSNRLISMQLNGGTTYALATDAVGNITSDARSGQAYQYDIAHRMTAVTGKESYLYDGNGRRARTLNTATGTIEYFGYSADGRLLQDSSNRRGVRNAYVYLGNSLVGLYEVNLSTGATASRYKHTDALGSPVVTTDATRTVSGRQLYTPYGVPLAPVDGVGYTGHFNDAGTRLTYMQQRYYDPAIGRFLSVDPIASDTSTGWNFSRYNYAANNPYKFKDPDGRIIETVWDVANVVMDVASLGTNLAVGNYAGAAVDAGGLLVDLAATAIPGVPGGAGTAIKLSRAAQLAQNARQGAKAEKVAAQKLGDQVAGKRVTLEASTGQRSVADLVTKDKGVVEVKSGNAQLSPGQKAIQADIDAGRSVTPRGQNAANAGLEPGKPTQMKCFSVDRC